MVKAGQKTSPYYEKGKIEIDIGEGKTGVINWETRFIAAIGMVASPSSADNPAQGKVLARRGATVDAQKNLLETIKGVRIDSETIVSDLMEVSEVTKTQVEGTLRDAEITEEKWDGEIYEVTMQVAMGTIFKIFEKSDDESPGEETGSIKKSKYTGLVVDTRGLGLSPAIFFNIYNEEGEKICGPIHPVYRVSIKDIKDINEGRIGTNPLRITAKDTTGPNGVDIVISNKDATKVKKNVLNTDIFSKGKVIVLVD